MGLLRISKELQLGDYSHDEPCASLMQQEVENSFIEGWKMLGGRQLTSTHWRNGESEAFCWLPCDRLSLAETFLARNSLLPVGLCHPQRAWELPLLASQLFSDWGFCLLIFTLSYLRPFSALRIIQSSTWKLSWCECQLFLHLSSYTHSPSPSPSARFTFFHFRHRPHSLSPLTFWPCVSMPRALSPPPLYPVSASLFLRGMKKMVNKWWDQKETESESSGEIFGSKTEFGESPKTFSP